ncbi:response regulator [Desulfoferrobacter suflitae]|uniref:response regulator n=1 Tax=Desulfoferrobacter suflitae TaxID=2865782 RepID=UPI0021645857|nr:response regulator [Desulfoferrobacter suflitae]MCK8601591.1 response regulator [Desulfoferrobacter suflitae]
MEPCKVLLVDDEVEFVLALAERLTIRGLHTQVAHNGEQALFVLQDYAPDAVLLDLKMPGMDGLEVLRRVKKINPQVKVVILTGHGSEQDAEIAQRLGASGYLQKPADIGVIVDTIKRACSGFAD